MEREFEVRLEIASVMIQRRVRGIYFRRKSELATKAAIASNSDDPNSKEFIEALRSAWKFDEGNKKQEDLPAYWLRVVQETKTAFKLDALKTFKDAMLKFDDGAKSRRLSALVSALIEQHPLHLNATALAKAQSMTTEGDEESSVAESDEEA